MTPQNKPTAGESKCILSKVNIQKNGYDRVYFKGKTWGAHRLAYTLSNGPITRGKYILHKCDVRNCVNPKHLYEGTAKDNAQDCLRRGRHTSVTSIQNFVRGSKHPDAKLKEEYIPKIIKLHKDGLSYMKIANIYGVCQTTIVEVIRRITWKHVKI